MRQSVGCIILWTQQGLMVMVNVEEGPEVQEMTVIMPWADVG